MSQHVGYAAIEEHDATLNFRAPIGTHLPGQHQFGERQRILPGQSATANCHLILDYRAAGFNGSRVAGVLQGVYERAFARTGSAGQDEKSVCIVRHATTAPFEAGETTF